MKEWRFIVDILECREKLDVIDKQILELFEKRMDIAKNVAEYKIKNDKPVLDTVREEQKLKATSDMVENKEYEQGAVELFTQLMSMSRKLQYKMIDKKDEIKSIVVDKLDIHPDTRVAFFGVEGSYAEQAMINYFGENVVSRSYDTFEKVMKAVKDNEADLSKCEYLIPDVVCELVESNEASVKILPTTARWQGITYKEDKEALVEGLNKLVEDGIYPNKLWN